MKNLPLAVRVFALALGALVTQSCQDTDTLHGHYEGNRYDDHPRYDPDQGYSEGRYRQPEADRWRGGYDEEDDDEGRQPSMVVPVPGY